jgi:hypothetical protein
MEPEGYRVAGSRPQKAIPIKIPVANASSLPHTSALPGEPGTVKQHQHAMLESVGQIERGEQQDFNDIVLGIKEGSLEVTTFINIIFPLSNCCLSPNNIVEKLTFTHSCTRQYYREVSFLKTRTTRSRARRVKKVITR